MPLKNSIQQQRGHNGQHNHQTKMTLVDGLLEQRFLLFVLGIGLLNCKVSFLILFFIFFIFHFSFLL